MERIAWLSAIVAVAHFFRIDRRRRRSRQFFRDLGAEHGEELDPGGLAASAAYTLSDHVRSTEDRHSAVAA